MKAISKPTKVITVFLCLVLALSPFTAFAAEYAIPDILADNGLPVVNITIDESAEGFGTIEEMNGSPDHSVKCTGSVKITVPDGYTGDYSDTALSDTKDLALEYIRGRGNTTWHNDKKPYKFKLDKKADLLGMGKNKHWVLLANDKDTTLLRNRIISYMGTELELAYTPKMLPVDVVMNGEYLGSYYLSEQVRVGDTRVDIDELTDKDNDEPEITGGYLLSLSPYPDAPEENIFYTEKNVGFGFENPEFYSDDPTDELGTAAQKAYISNYLQETENAVYSGNVSEYMDLQSAADYWWIQEFSLNVDAFRTDSTYLYKPRGDKLYWGPLWDFDLSLGKSRGETFGFNQSKMPWLDYLRENNEDFQQLLRERWTVLDGIITDIVKDGGVMDRYMAEIRNSWEDNLPKSESPYGIFELEMESLRTWIAERQEWINENMGLLSDMYSTVTFTADGQQVEQKVLYTGYLLEELPAIPEKEGYVTLGWEYEGELLDENTLPNIWEDTVITAKYISEQDAIFADTLYFESYDVWADINGYFNQYYSAYTVTPEDAQERSIAWSISDESIAEVDENGVVTMKKTGEVVVTGTLKSGFSRSYTLHIYDSEITPENEPQSIALEQTTITLKVGEYAQIVATVSPQPCASTVSYSYEGELISLLDYGVIKALAPGTTTVNVYVTEGVEANCTVIVTDGEEATVPSTEATTEASTTATETTAATTSATTAPTTSATTAASSTTGSSSAASGGAVQTGQSSVALILLLTLAAAVCLIFCFNFQRSKEEH